MSQKIKFLATICLLSIFSLSSKAQDEIIDDAYIMGYEKADIQVINSDFFGELSFPDIDDKVCGFYDRKSGNFYTCEYATIRDIDEDWISPVNSKCCDAVDFDARRYYGSLTVQGTVDSVAWDDLTIYMTTAHARVVIVTDEKEIDAFYENFYEDGRLGKLNVVIKLVTYDTVVENRMSQARNKPTRKKPKKLIKFLRF